MNLILICPIIYVFDYNLLTETDIFLEDEKLMYRILACSINSINPNSNFPKYRIFSNYDSRICRFLAKDMNPIYTIDSNGNYILHLTSKNKNDSLVIRTIREDPEIPDNLFLVDKRGRKESIIQYLT